MNQLISTYMPYSARTEYSIFNLFGSQHLPSVLHRPIPAPEPHPEPNPEPDTALGCAPTIIATSDWDTLFQAILERLENCVNDQSAKAVEQPLHEWRIATKTTVLECAAAMRQLHTALAVERQQR